MNLHTLFKAHQGLGYLTLVLGLLVVCWSFLTALRESRPGRAESILSSITVGFIDLQVVVGLVLFYLYSSETRPTWWHPVLMLVGLVSFHLGNRRHSWDRFVRFAAGLVLLVVGWTLLL